MSGMHIQWIPKPSNSEQMKELYIQAYKYPPSVKEKEEKYYNANSQSIPRTTGQLTYSLRYSEIHLIPSQIYLVLNTYTKYNEQYLHIQNTLNTAILKKIMRRDM